MFFAVVVRLSRASASSRGTSKVPFGTWIRSLTAGLDELLEERVRLALALERRRAHVPGWDGRLARQGVQQRADGAQQRRVIAARQVRAADRPLEQDVAGEDDLRLGDRVGDVPRRVAGQEQDVDVEAGQLQPLAAGDQLIRLVGLE